MPWKELGYAAGFVVVLAALYVGAYYAMVKRDLEEIAVNGAGGRLQAFVVPRYPAVGLDALFSPIHQIDKRIRLEFWSLEGAISEFNAR